MHKNIIITVIAAIALLAAAPASADGTHLSVKGNDGGRILNCFGWRYNTIKAKLGEPTETKGTSPVYTAGTVSMQASGSPSAIESIWISDSSIDN